MDDPFDPMKAREIFASACDLESDKQESFVRDACNGRVTLYEEVMSLLRFDALTESGDGISSNPAITKLELGDHPERIDRYEIEDVIGYGGCGVVYKAHQSTPIERVVAIKVIRPGMDSGSVLRRFEFERKALERMNHPNIARVLDSGIVPSESSIADRPYFVMELVQGQPITKFVAKHKLSITQVVELLMQICAAVQHAHSKGILHRDIKPSNVLVTHLDGNPQCKIIDFGIAKALDESMLDTISMTSVDAMIGTPRYMSPEQMGSGTDVDTRTDVYSIGVLMYELFAGQSPFPLSDTSQSIPALLRAIDETNPLPPSDRTQSLPQDLDWITLRAMDRDPARRYQTVAALADDLERFLKHEPVTAGPPTVRYKLTKFYTRNRASVFTGAVALIALIAGTSVSLAFGLQANTALKLESEQREIAQRQTKRVQDINDFLLEDLFLAGAIEKLGPQVTLVKLLDSAAPTIDERFSDDVNMRARAHFLISQMYANASLFENARQHAIEALEFINQLDEWSPVEVAHLHGNAGKVYHTLGELDNARDEYERQYNILKQIHPPVEDEIEIARSGYAAILVAQEDYEQAEPILKDVTEYMLAQVPIDLFSLTTTVLNRIAMLGSMNRHLERLDLSEWLLNYLNANDPDDEMGSTLIARMHYTSALSQVGRSDEAITSVELMLTEIGDRYGYNSPASAGMLQNAATISSQLELYEQAIQYRTRSLEIYTEVFGNHSYEVELALNNIAMYHDRLGNDQEHQAWRIRGLIQRIYVAGPGEDESLTGVSAIGMELIGSGEDWAKRVIEEFDQVPINHPKRGRYLANTAIALGVGEVPNTVDRYTLSSRDYKTWLEQAAEAITSAQRPDEVRRIVLGVLPPLLERLDETTLAREWRNRLSE